MRIRKRRMRWGRSEIAQGVDQWIGIFLAIVICFFALQQGYGVQNMHDITQVEPDHLAVHTMERQQGSFLDILGRSELTQLEQARLTVSARITRLNAERNVILWAGLASGFAGNATRIYLASCRIENIFVRSHAWIMAYIHWQDGEKAMPLSQLFEVLFDSSVVVKYPIF